MTWWPRRPRLSLRVPRRATLGQPLEGVLNLVLDAPLRVLGVQGSLHGSTRALRPSQNQQPVYVPDIDERWRVHEATTFEAGRHTLPFRLVIPGDTPPSYRAHHERRDYKLTLRLLLPWWFDPQVTVPLDVRTLAPDELTSAPRVATSEEDPRGVLELSLDEDTVRRGERLTGRVALLRGDASVRSVKVSLLEWLGDGAAEDHFLLLEEKNLELVKLQAEEVIAGEPVGFEFVVPKTLGEEFRCTDRRLFHEVVATAHGPLGVSRLQVSCALRVAPDTTRLVRADRDRPLIGKTRQDEQLRRVAERVGATSEGGQLRASVDGVQVVVLRSQGRERELLFRGELTFDDLGLGLHVGDLPLRESLFGGFTLPWLTAADQVRGRDRAQVEALLSALRRELAPFTAVRGDDHALIVEREGSEEEAPLEEVARQVLALARALRAAYSRLTPPVAAASLLTQWRGVATMVGGELNAAAMRVEGSHEGQPVEVRLLWSSKGAPAGVLLALGIEARGMAGRPRELDLAHDLGELPAGLRAQLADLQRLELTDSRLELTMGRVPQSTAEVCDWIETLGALARRLTSTGSPYR